MKYYFYDELGNVNLTYHIMPPEEVLYSQKYITSDLVFEDKPNMITVYKVNLKTKELYVEYKERPLTPEEELKKIKEENLTLTDYALDLDLRLTLLETTKK